MLVAVPNISEGRDPALIAAIGDAYVAAGAHLLDTHSDPDHNRTVHTIAAPQGTIAEALAAGAQAAIDLVDIRRKPGIHPHVGALDVAPVVHLDDSRRGAACAEALLAAHLIGELGLPVFLYGLLGGGRQRAEIRRGGPAALTQRMAAGETGPDFGPSRPHDSAGACLVAARPPLIAFNVELAAPATLEDAKAIAAAIREGGEAGLPGLRAIGLELAARDGVAQVSMNIEDHIGLRLAAVVAAIRERADITEAEVVGLPPTAAFDGFPEDIPVRNRRTVEDALDSVT